jgi:hypothetical protein
LPLADGSFDVVLSTFGVMFVLDQEKAASEAPPIARSRRSTPPSRKLWRLISWNWSVE